jgi:hypothetical protein
MSPDRLVVGEIAILLDRYPHLHENEPIGDGVAQLLQRRSADGLHLHYDELLVINAEQHLVGQLSVQNILSSFFPSILTPNPVTAYVGKKERYTDLSILLEDSFRKECRRQAAKVVREYMSKPRHAIDISMHPLQALEIMIKDNMNSLPVIEQTKLIGAVRITDIFRVLGTYCTL